VIPANDPAFYESSVLIYGKVHRALVSALRTMGKPAVIAEDTDPSGISSSIRAALRPSSCSCFENPVRADVILEGRKVAGAAQRRARHGLLHQGSIQGFDFGNGLPEQFAFALSAKPTKSEIEKHILNRAQELARQKYVSDSWTRKR
jgi:lipoate-protein ligase A